MKKSLSGPASIREIGYGCTLDTECLPRRRRPVRCHCERSEAISCAVNGIMYQTPPQHIVEISPNRTPHVVVLRSPSGLAQITVPLFRMRQAP